MRGTKTGALTPGDSLSKIAKRYKTSTDEIAKNNNIKDVSKIFPSQHLTIYGAKTNSPLIYIVVPGDTLAKIAEKNGANVDDIARQNNISDPNKIYPGQSISIRKNGNNTAVESDNSAINPPTSKTVSKKQLQNKEVNSNKKRWNQSEEKIPVIRLRYFLMISERLRGWRLHSRREILDGNGGV
ncbi:LysM peptidoglycan-binding domain-containing protein [Klebsiella variicola]|uniref:LysM peptidoglycan-binding domain-containing protein n=2 Tax=Klebsiella pneumoniae complex TaxID=3390273 RepID=UPI002158E37A|nr:LysM peptidoglycan-binding domain-containing protein [Klebsiella variicola]